ncbi:MAG: flagellar FliJ family protein [Gemmatimonadaceae bacterium]
MMYKFPLQRLLDLKAKREQEIARQLADARRGADSERGVRDSLAAAHAAAHRSVSEATSAAPTVGEIVSLSYTLLQLSERVEMATERTSAAEQVVDTTHQALNVALQERRVLDRLRDKRLELHRDEEKARDLQEMDAIALTRFNLPADSSGASKDA